MTTKQIMASKNLLENGGNVTQAMLKAGYSPNSVNNPKTLTQSKAYKEIVLPKLRAAGVTLDRYIANVGDAMKSTNKVQRGYKTIVTGKGDSRIKTSEPVIEEEPNIALRLAGNKQAEKLLKIDTLVGSEESNELEPEDLAKLADISDEIELTRLVFKKKT